MKNLYEAMLRGEDRYWKSDDRNRTQEAIGTLDPAQSEVDTVRNQMIVPTTQNMYNNYLTGSQNAFADYGDIMGRYRDAAGSIGQYDKVNAPTIGYSRTGELNKAMQGFSEFADTGGLNSQAQADLRARGISPIRAAYGNTMRELDRSRSLGGPGGASNYIAARSAAQREMPQQLADATQNVNAGIAQMVQQGRLAGMSGLSDAAKADIGFTQDAAARNQDATLRASLANQNAGLQANNLKLGALSGMSNLYSATPGQAQTFGNQVLNSTQNWLNTNSLQNDIAKTRINAQLGKASVPTGFQAFLGNAGKIGDIFSNAADTLNPSGSWFT